MTEEHKTRPSVIDFFVIIMKGSQDITEEMKGIRQRKENENLFFLSPHTGNYKDQA
jgi:hypothetical protein